MNSSLSTHRMDPTIFHFSETRLRSCRLNLPEGFYLSNHLQIHSICHLSLAVCFLLPMQVEIIRALLLTFFFACLPPFGSFGLMIDEQVVCEGSNTLRSHGFIRVQCIRCNSDIWIAHCSLGGHRQMPSPSIGMAKCR